MTANASVYRNRKLEDTINNCKPHSRIDLRKQKLTAADLEIIIQQAIIQKQCTMLWLTDNQITSHGISTLAATLHDNPVLEGLSLCNNGISDSNLRYLTEALSNHQSKLNRLALTSNEITDIGAKYLADMPEINQSLTQLWLGINQITDHGVKLLANTLAQHNQTLHVLSLAWNKLITDSSIEILLDMFENNQSLRTVCLSNCDFSDVGKTKLRNDTELYKEFYLDL